METASAASPRAAREGANENSRPGSALRGERETGQSLDRLPRRGSSAPPLTAADGAVEGGADG